MSSLDIEKSLGSGHRFYDLLSLAPELPYLAAYPTEINILRMSSSFPRMRFATTGQWAARGGSGSAKRYTACLPFN